MNQANTLCMVAILLMMWKLASILCYGLNPTNLGGWGPSMLMVVLPLVAYGLGRYWKSEPTNRRKIVRSTKEL